MPFEYLLGDSAPEVERLRAQAALWDPVSHALFDRIGVGPGWRVLEVGPGAGSLHAELRRRVSGPVDAVEQSWALCMQLAEIARADGLGAGRLWNAQVLDGDLADDHYDLIFARWVFLFLPQPLEHVKKLADALRPGGRLVIQDYYRNTFCLVPRPADWDAFIAADLAFFATQGANANAGSELPRWYREAGLETESVHPTTMTGHPGSAVWSWLSTYFLGVMDQYAELPPFGAEGARRIEDAWRDAAKDPSSLLIAPTVLDVVGRKPYHPEQKRAMEYLARKGTQAPAEKLRAQLRDAFAAAEQAFDAVPIDKRERSPAEGKWSPHEILDHLVLSHGPAIPQLASALAGVSPRSPAVPADLHRTERPAWDALRTELGAIHQEFLGLIETATDDLSLDAKVMIEMVVKVNARPVRWLEPLDWKASVQGIRMHTLEHLNQLERTL